MVKFNAGGYYPWESDAVARALVGQGNTGRLLAGGGLINEPVVGFGQSSGRKYTIGERGPEMVTPLSKMQANGSGAGTAGNIYVTVQAGDCIDPNAVAQAIHKTLRRYKTKRGNAPLGLD